MTTNQTIGGVPRELLADLADYGESGKAPEPWMVDKLRALLDAPACNECEDVGYHVTMGAQRSCWACKPAAQTQGEPVARVEIGADRDAVMTITDDNWLRSLKARGIHQIVPLYAEQPAPVAVVLPERKDPGEYRDGSYTQTCMSGEWNACLDELKLLNPSL